MRKNYKDRNVYHSVERATEGNYVMLYNYKTGTSETLAPDGATKDSGDGHIGFNFGHIKL